MMEQAKRDKAVDVYGFVCKMRNKRMKMVQTSVSLAFKKSALNVCKKIIFKFIHTIVRLCRAEQGQEKAQEDEQH